MPPDSDPPPADPPAGDTPPDPPQSAAAGGQDPEPLGETGKKALEAEREARKTAEKQARAAAAELEKFRKAAMSDQEKAIVEAREQGATEATKAAGERLAAAEIRAALTGVVPDPAAIVEDLALGRYVGDDGEPDPAAIKKLRDKYEALGAARKVPGVPAGPRGNGKEPTLDQQYADAMKSGDVRLAISLQNQKLLQQQQ